MKPRFAQAAPRFGPLIVATAFVLFAIPGVGASYWTAFFPAFLVLGFGMAIRVAPLTTVVMSAVGQDGAGTASGINNAVARVAGVLAIAVLGIVMVKVFSSSLSRSLMSVDIPASALQYIRSSEIKLGGLELPGRMNSATTGLIHAAIIHAFVLGFRAVMLICAGLSLASAAVATAMIPARTE